MEVEGGVEVDVLQLGAFSSSSPFPCCIRVPRSQRDHVDLSMEELNQGI